MDVLSKPAIRIHPTAPIVEVNDPDDIQNQINSSLYDEKECNLLFEEIEIMRKDYDNWETIFKDIYSKVKPEIILWEKAYKDVCEMLEKNNTQENFTGSECGPYVRIVHQYKQSRFLKKESEEELPLFTLPKALALIQQKIISLKTSMINVQIDEQYVSLQRDKINCIEKCLKNRERYLTHKRIAEEKLASSTDNLEKESQESSEGQQDCNEKFKEVMSLVEKDASLLSEIRNDISLLFNELPSFQSEDEPDSGVNLVRKEIDELLLNWGKEKEQSKSISVSANSLVESISANINLNEIDDTENNLSNLQSINESVKLDSSDNDFFSFMLPDNIDLTDSTIIHNENEIPNLNSTEIDFIKEKTLEIELAEDQDNLISCKEFESTETTCASQIGKEDHNFVRNHRDEINCIEKCIKKKEILLAQNKIAVEKLKKISAHLARESHRFSEDLQISDGEFNEFMLGVEQDNNSLSHITEDIVLLFNELSTLHSKFGTNSGINSVKKEIDELLLELGKEKNQAKPTDLFKNDLIVSNGIHPNENNSCAIDSTGNLTKNNWNKDETNSTEGNIIEFESLKDTFTSHLGKKDHKNVNSGSEKMNLIKRCIQKKEVFLAQNKIAVEKLKYISRHFSQEPQKFLVGQKDLNAELYEFMLEVEKNNTAISHITDDILLLFDKFSALRCTNITNNAIIGVRKEIDKLLSKWGEDTEKAESTSPCSNQTEIDLNKIDLIDLTQETDLWNLTIVDTTEEIGVTENGKGEFIKIQSTTNDEVERNTSTEGEINKYNLTNDDSTNIEPSETVSTAQNENKCKIDSEEECLLKCSGENKSTSRNSDFDHIDEEIDSKPAAPDQELHKSVDKSLQDLRDLLSLCSLSCTEREEPTDNELTEIDLSKNNSTKVDLFIPDSIENESVNKNEENTSKSGKPDLEVHKLVDNYLEDMGDLLSLFSLHFIKKDGSIDNNSKEIKLDKKDSTEKEPIETEGNKSDSTENYLKKIDSTGNDSISIDSNLEEERKSSCENQFINDAENMNPNESPNLKLHKFVDDSLADMRDLLSVFSLDSTEKDDCIKNNFVEIKLDKSDSTENDSKEMKENTNDSTENYLDKVDSTVNDFPNIGTSLEEECKPNCEDTNLNNEETKNQTKTPNPKLNELASDSLQDLADLLSLCTLQSPKKGNSAKNDSSGKELNETNLTKYDATEQDSTEIGWSTFLNHKLEHCVNDSLDDNFLQSKINSHDLFPDCPDAQNLADTKKSIIIHKNTGYCSFNEVLNNYEQPIIESKDETESDVDIFYNCESPEKTYVFKTDQ